MLDGLDGRYGRYEKGEYIFRAGNPAEKVGIVLDGSVEIVRDNWSGNRSILTKLSTGEIFGETFVSAGIDTLPVSVMAAGECQILLVNYRAVLTAGPMPEPYYSQLISNMHRILAQKNWMLHNKMEVLSARTIREKLLTYLNMLVNQEQSLKVTVPFNRQALADYLCVDRSALSREIGAMCRAGLIEVHGRQFVLLHSES